MDYRNSCEQYRKSYERARPKTPSTYGVAATRLARYCARNPIALERLAYDRAVWVPEDDRAFATRLACYCARNPIVLERLAYDRAGKTVTYRSDKAEGPMAGTETVDPLEFLARVPVHIPEKGQVTTRYYGWYANRPRGRRRRAESPAPIVTPPQLAPTEANRRWAALLRQIFEVDPLRCPQCRGTLRIIAVITQTAVIDQILTHLGTRTAAGARTGARSPPSTRAPTTWGATRRPTATPIS